MIKRSLGPIAFVIAAVTTALVPAPAAAETAPPEQTTTDTTDVGAMLAESGLLSITPPTFDAVGRLGQLTVTGAVPGKRIHLLEWIAVDDHLGVRHVDTSRFVDAQGSVMFRELPAGYYLVASNREINWAVEVRGTDSPPPPQSFYDDQELVNGFQYIETRDGTLLSANVVLPGPVEDGPYPTVVEYSGYDPSNPTVGRPAQPGSLIANAFGYAVVGINVRGTGCSGGAYDFFETMQVLDGYDVIEAVAAQDWVKHNRVGMVGLSYPGISQLFVAKSQPPSLAAITPLSVYGDTATGVLAPGGVLNTGFATSWADNVLRNARPNGTGWVRSVIADGDSTCATNQQLRLQNVDAVAKARANLFYTDEVAGPLDIRNWSPDIDVPIFLASAFQDEQTGPSFADLLGTFDSSPSVRAMVYNGLHADGFAPQILSEWNAFLDLYVDREIPSAPAGASGVAPLLTQAIYGAGFGFPADRWTDVTTYDEALARWESEDEIRILFEDGAAPGVPTGLPVASWEQTTDVWPIAETEPTRWWFTADGRLVDAPEDQPGLGVQFRPDPAESQTSFYTSGGIWQRSQTFNWQTQDPGENLRFQSAPLADDTVMAGNASVDVWLRTDATDAELEAVLSEVRPDGREMRIQSGQLQVSYRSLDESSTDLEPVQYGYEADHAPLVPGEWTQVRIQIPAFAHAFRSGSSVRVEINTPGGDTAQWEFELDGPGAEATHVINTGIDHPSSINLPVIPGWVAQTDLPGCTLRGMPCRVAAPIANVVVTSEVEPVLPEGYEGYVSEQYSGPTNWMCLPDKEGDVCARDLDATAVYADGTTEIIPFERAASTDVDCFYVYPTISVDASAISDLTPGEGQEIATTLGQAARFGETCRVFAPVYRQRTLGSLVGQYVATPEQAAIPYTDVVDAFKQFIAQESSGGPFVLIGHSQGAGLLSRLIDNEIDDEPLLRDRMMSAVLLGTSISPTRFTNIPPCTAVGDAGCVVTYSSYRNTSPPPANALFGRTSTGPALCVNPVDPASGSAYAHPYFALSPGSLSPFDDPARNAEITTPWVTYPDMVKVQCVNNATFGYLELTIDQVAGPRANNISGDLTPQWGMHTVDANIATGDLVGLVAAQAAAGV
jgi:uncharacterized protein